MSNIIFLLTRAGEKLFYYTLLVYKLFLQRTYSDTQGINACECQDDQDC